MDNRLHAPKHMSETSSTMLAQPRKSTKHQPASQTPSENSRCWHFTTGQSCKPAALSKGVAEEQTTCLIDVTMSYLNDHRSVDDGSNKICGMLPEGDDTTPFSQMYRTKSMIIYVTKPQTCPSSKFPPNCT